MLRSFSLRGLSYQRDIELNYYAVLARLGEEWNANKVAKTERFITNVLEKILEVWIHMNICSKKYLKTLKVIPKYNRICNNPNDSRRMQYKAGIFLRWRSFTQRSCTPSCIYHMRDMAKAGVTRTGSRGRHLER